MAGGGVLSWQPPLASAVLSRSAERFTESAFPDLTVDNFSLELDDDGDQLTNPAEVALGSDPRLADSDGDGLPDGWEQRVGLDPLADDAGLDPDGDLFTSAEEYAAATGPRDPLQWPGQPSDLQAGPTTRAVLRLLALRPAPATSRFYRVVGRNRCGPGPAD